MLENTSHSDVVTHDWGFIYYLCHSPFEQGFLKGKVFLPSTRELVTFLSGSTALFSSKNRRREEDSSVDAELFLGAKVCSPKPGLVPRWGKAVVISKSQITPAMLALGFRVDKKIQDHLELEIIENTYFPPPVRDFPQPPTPFLCSGSSDSRKGWVGPETVSNRENLPGISLHRLLHGSDRAHYRKDEK